MINRKQLFRGPTAHIFAVSLILGGVGLWLVSVQDSLKKAESTIRESLKVVVFIQSNVAEDLAKAWTEALPSQDPALASATFISRQEALNKAQENPLLMKSIILLRDNPLPATALLRYKDSAWLDRPEPAVALRSAAEVQEIRWDPEARSQFQMLHQWRTQVGLLSLVAISASLISTAAAFSWKGLR